SVFGEKALESELEHLKHVCFANTAEIAHDKCLIAIFFNVKVYRTLLVVAQVYYNESKWTARRGASE
ncbi:MAG: hypothetical protein IKL81_02120, partial [Clostridia bacterium]|nr:hypothetical protein [Clostridia bacterium]